MLRVMLKLKLVKFGLRAWNSRSFGIIFLQIAEARSHLQKVHNRMADVGFSKVIFEEELKAHEILDGLIWNHELMLHDEARIQWLKDGNCNSSFFALCYDLGRLISLLILCILMVWLTLIVSYSEACY